MSVISRFCHSVYVLLLGSIEFAVIFGIFIMYILCALSVWNKQIRYIVIW